MNSGGSRLLALAPCVSPSFSQPCPGMTYPQGTSAASTTAAALLAARSPAVQTPGTASACSPRYHGAVMALTSSSTFLQSFGVPFSTPALGCQGSHHPVGLRGSGAQSRCPCPQGPSCKVESPRRDSLRKELPKLGRDGAAEATVLFRGQPHPRAGSYPLAWWNRRCRPVWSCSPLGWGAGGSLGWGRRRWQCPLQPWSPHG